MPSQPIFSPDWPRYAVAAHILFWIVSMLFLASCVAGYLGMIGGQIALSLFWGAIVAAFLFGLAAIASGRMYVGNQVFRRRPLNGVSARLYGLAVSAGAALLLWFAYGLMQLGR
jgi:hypothetical protein